MAPYRRRRSRDPYRGAILAPRLTPAPPAGPKDPAEPVGREFMPSTEPMPEPPEDDDHAA